MSLRRAMHAALWGAALGAGGPVMAQDTAAPLSAIDWLDDVPVAQPTVSEPTTANSATSPDVKVQPLDGPAARRVGLVPARVTGLPDTLWSASEARDLAQRLAALPGLKLPALQQVLYTLVLAEANPPKGDAAAFDLARIDLLLRYGALDPAQALMDQAGADASAMHLARAFDMGLITDRTGGPCALLQSQPRLSPGKGHEIFCAARAGDWDTAALQLGTAQALELLTEAETAALARFLDPELFEADLPLPATPDALQFRLFAAAGQPVPTRGWPLVYAHADLADTAGWKTRLEAAERLAQSSSLPGNTLLGLYSERQAAASGGVWDRVRAVQRFETALGTGSASAVAKTLPEAWRVMAQQGLLVPFAALFAEQVEGLGLSGAAADTAYALLLLSPRYETAGRVFPARAVRQPVLDALAQGTVPLGLEADGLAGAALAAFGDAPADARIVALAQDGALGAAILDAIALAHDGQAGDVAQFRTGLATLRALGLEDIARRTALQTLILADAP